MQIYDKNAPGFDSVIEPSLVAKMSSSNDSATLIEKSITENGTYDASTDNADGYKKVTVDVAGGGGETFEVELEHDFVSPDDFTTNKSYDMVKAAIQANKVIKFIWSLKQQGEVVLSGTTSAVDYNSEGDFMAIATTATYSGRNVSYVFLWGNPETYTHVSKDIVSMIDELS